AGNVRVVAVVVERVVVVVDEVPADQVVGLAVAVGVHPVGPAGVREDVMAVPEAVAVGVVELGGVGGGSCVAEGAQSGAGLSGSVGCVCGGGGGGCRRRRVY